MEFHAAISMLIGPTDRSGLGFPRTIEPQH
jgi:hypothetical protein